MTKMLTKQQLFDKVSVHLLKQNEKSIDEREEENCQYLSPDKLKCAIGCLIPKKHYDVDMEDNTIRELFDDVDLKKLLNTCGISIRYLDLLNALQRTHDDFEIVEWVDELRHVAEMYNLFTAKMDRVK